MTKKIIGIGLIILTVVVIYASLPHLFGQVSYITMPICNSDQSIVDAFQNANCFMDNCAICKGSPLQGEELVTTYGVLILSIIGIFSMAYFCLSAGLSYVQSKSTEINFDFDNKTLIAGILSGIIIFLTFLNWFLFSMGTKHNLETIWNAGAIVLGYFLAVMCWKSLKSKRDKSSSTKKGKK